MTDGLGPVDYDFDTWSRLRSEARHLDDLAQTFTTRYEYNLAGSLTTLTDPFNSVVTYAYDQGGQLTSVSGSGPGSVPTYISQIQYRAWGAPKQITYGNGVNMSTSYNTRLQVSSFSVPGVMGASLSYYSDGRIHTERSTADRRFDRA